jgi:hypothetical protein
MPLSPPQPGSPEGIPDGINEDAPAELDEPMPRWVKVFFGVIVGLLLVAVITHLVGGGFRHHGG